MRAMLASAQAASLTVGVHMHVTGRAVTCDHHATASRSRIRRGRVMSDAPDMSTPVTRGGLRAELAQLEMRLERKLAQVATKAELELWGGALLARIESGEKRMIELMGGMEQRLLAELARHSRANAESLSAQISVVDEKYADLPDRVKQLETKMAARKRH
jgi:hypothetical protein